MSNWNRCCRSKQQTLTGLVWYDYMLWYTQCSEYMFNHVLPVHFSSFLIFFHQTSYTCCSRQRRYSALLCLCYPFPENCYYPWEIWVLVASILSLYWLWASICNIELMDSIRSAVYYQIKTGLGQNQPNHRNSDIFF